jgi:hypothetical protein
MRAAMRQMNRGAHAHRASQSSPINQIGDDLPT